MSSDVRILVHAWFHTKDNAGWITEEVETRLVPYMGGIIKVKGCVLIQGGCSDDHVHLLIQLHPRNSLEDLMRSIKGSSSRWVGQMWPELTGHSWQHGYGAISIPGASVETIARYIRGQRGHHGKHAD